MTLRVYVDKKDIGKTQWAMESLKKSMAWDERRFGERLNLYIALRDVMLLDDELLVNNAGFPGLEYDLDIFNIVAVSDFNMGYAFHACCLLACRYCHSRL